jgi:hypothetical protein
MRDPVPGTFHIVSYYFPHPGCVPMQVMLAGFVEADGVPRTTAETLDNYNHDHSSTPDLPTLIDRTDPTRFIVMWDQVQKADGGKAQAQADAERETRRE